MQSFTECSGKETEEGGGAQYNGLDHKLKVILGQTPRQIEHVKITLKRQKTAHDHEAACILGYKDHILSRSKANSVT
jgi:hypothetical protein